MVFRITLVIISARMVICTCMTYLVAPYCAILRDYLSDTPLLRDMGFLVSQHGQLGAIPPYPPLRYYLERVLRDMGGGGISHWAAKMTYIILHERFTLCIMVLRHKRDRHLRSTHSWVTCPVGKAWVGG